MIAKLFFSDKESAFCPLIGQKFFLIPPSCYFLLKHKEDKGGFLSALLVRGIRGIALIIIANPVSFVYYL